MERHVQPTLVHSISLIGIAAPQSDHTRMKRLYAHAFTDTALLEQAPLLTRYFDLLVSKLKQRIDGSDRGRVDIMAFYNFTTFDIIGNIIEWVRFGGVLRFINTYPALEFAFAVLKTIIPSLTTKHDAYLKFTEDKINKRLDLKTDRKDLMTNILRHNDERGMTREEIVATSRLMLVAGSETTSTFLGGATYNLLQNPECLRRLQSEVRAAFQTADEITLRAVSTPGLLLYLDAVIQESLRCFPPLPTALHRVVGHAGAIIDGNYIPKDISVGVHQWSTYRSSANFADPDTFDPERWMPDPPAKYQNDIKAALQPFSVGPRGCIGKSLAYFEMRSILARMIWHFDMQLEGESQGWTEQKEYAIWDKPALWVTLQHRAGK
ncbi:MAG: hypothetical protein Q9186_005832 [Xanthomendoza sp. 1 TL-2023]